MSPSCSIICRTMSHSPILTPPLVIIASHDPAASSSAFLRSSILSLISSDLRGVPPIFFTSEEIPNVLDSYIEFSERGSPGGVSSSPTPITAIERGRTTDTVSCPIVAAREIADGVSMLPDLKGRSPSVRFSPLLRMKSGLAGPFIVTEPS